MFQNNAIKHAYKKNRLVTTRQKWAYKFVAPKKNFVYALSKLVHQMVNCINRGTKHIDHNMNHKNQTSGSR